MSPEDLFAQLAPLYPAGGWWPSQSSFETAIGAILVQGVSWRNAAQAVEGLRQRGLLDPAALAAAREEEVALAVRPALYHHQKARYLQGFAATVHALGGMQAVGRLARQEQLRVLRAVRGIGEETAAAVMVYALGGREPVVDTYARRLFVRTGAVPSAEDAAIRDAMLSVIREDPSRARALHAAVVEHGRSYCRKEPRCANCPLAGNCPRILGEP